jgi:hypothetical protein
MFVTWSLWEAVRQVLALQLCLGEAVAAYFCATRGNLEIKRSELCTAC